MKRKHLSLILAASLFALTANACGAGQKTPSSQEGQETPTAPAADSEIGTDEPPTDSEAGADETTSENETAKSDKDVIIDGAAAVSSPISVTFENTRNEVKADDGTVIFTGSAQMPVVSIEGAEDVAGKINSDIASYFDTFSYDETLSLAQQDYAASLGEDGWAFLGYSADLSTKVTRMDEAVISFQITAYDFTGGAHGNYGSTGRNYSAKTGELLAFDEIAEDYEAFHATVLDYMMNLAETPAYKDKLFGPPSKNDLDDTLFRTDGWIFTKSGISLLAPPYSLGPYASGEIAFRLPYEKAYDLGLKEDYRYSGPFVEERYYISKVDPETFEPIVDGTPDCYFDLDGDGTEEGLAFYGQVVDPETGDSRYAFYIDGKDYGDIINDELQNIQENGYLEDTYALYHADAPNDGVPAIAVLFSEFGDVVDSDGNPVRQPLSFTFYYTKEDGLYYMYWDNGYVTLPLEPQR